MQNRQLKKLILRFPEWVYAKFKKGRHLRIGRTIAITFNENSIQLATVRNLLHKSKLLNVNKIYIPGSYNTEESRRNFIVREINKYIKQYGTYLTRNILGVGSADSAFRAIPMPDMPGKELNRAIRWEADKRVPFGLDDAYYGYHLTKAESTVTGGALLVSLIAVSKSEVDTLLQLLNSTDLKIKAVYHELEAVGRLLPYIKDYDATKTYALINIKRDRSEISYYRGKRLEFIHISSVGSAALSDTFGDKKYEAFTKSLVDEIQTSLDYYVGQFSNTSTDMVFVYGDLSYSDELISNLSDHFGIDFLRFPVNNLAESKVCHEEYHEQIPVSLSSVALAMIDYDLIDFIPPAIKERQASKSYIRKTVPGFIFITALLLSTWAMMRYVEKIRLNWLAESDEQIARLENSKPVIMYNQIKRQMAIDKEILKTLDKEPSYLHLNLKELSRITPKQIKLNLYDLEDEGRGKNLVIAGLVRSADPPPEVVLAEFIVRLESSPFFDKVNLDRHSKSFVGNRFAIDFQITMDAIL
jgi:Tfp pilus assembly PilM family ATPase